MPRISNFWSQRHANVGQPGAALTYGRKRAKAISPSRESGGVRHKRIVTVEAITTTYLGRYGSKVGSATLRGPIEHHRIGATETRAVAASDGARGLPFIASSGTSDGFSAGPGPRRYRFSGSHAIRISNAGCLAYPTGASCVVAHFATGSAVVSVGIGVDFAAIGRAMIAVRVPRAAANNAAGATRTRGGGVVSRTGRAASSAITRVGSQRFFATVCRTTVAIAEQIGTGAHRAGAARAGGRSIGV